MTWHEKQEDVARYKAAGLLAEYHWFDAETTATMLEELQKTCKANPGSQLRIYPGLNPAGQMVLWLCLYTPSTTAKGEEIVGFDASHPCPPFCS